MPQALALGALHPTAARRGLRRLQVRPELGLRQGHQRWWRDGQVVVLVWLRLRRWLVLRRWLQRWLQRRLLLGLRLRLVRRRQRGVQGPLPCQRQRMVRSGWALTARSGHLFNPSTERTLGVAQLHFRCADEGDALAPNPSTPGSPGICSQQAPEVAGTASRMPPQHCPQDRGVGRQSVCRGLGPKRSLHGSLTQPWLGTAAWGQGGPRRRSAGEARGPGGCTEEA